MTFVHVVYLIIILIFIWSLFYFKGSMHIFQLNSYKNDIHIKWLVNNRFSKFAGLKKAKKPLVYTHRVIRMCVTSAFVYSITATLITFAALFISNYFLLTALLLLPISVLLPIIANIINAPFEKFNNARYINEAKKIINEHKNLITIGITGSYGKTSTKYFLEKLLSVKYNVLMTPESFNTTLGVVKTIRQSLKATHEIFLCEMGLMWVGDIKELCELVKPKHGIITSIGPQHLETMRSMENIIKEKFELANSIEDGMVFLNGENEYICGRKIKKNVIKYGTQSVQFDYSTDNISVSEKGTSFDLTSPDGQIVRFNTPLLGEHNVLNITGAIAIAHKFGVSLQELIRPVKKLEPVPHRLQIINKGDNIIIDDAFNSNLIGAKAALDVLKMFNGTRFLVTPGMVELAEKSHELNKEFGAHAAYSCDFAVLIGEKQAVPIKEGLLENNFPQDKIYIFKTLNEGLNFINAMDFGEEQKIILLENDLPDNY